MKKAFPSLLALGFVSFCLCSCADTDSVKSSEDNVRLTEAQINPNPYAEDLSKIDPEKLKKYTHFRDSMVADMKRLAKQMR